MRRLQNLAASLETEVRDAKLKLEASENRAATSEVMIAIAVFENECLVTKLVCDRCTCCTERERGVTRKYRDC